MGKLWAIRNEFYETPISSRIFHFELPGDVRRALQLPSEHGGGGGQSLVLVIGGGESSPPTILSYCHTLLLHHIPLFPSLPRIYLQHYLQLIQSITLIREQFIIICLSIVNR